MNQRLIAQGAEAKIFLVNGIITKDRIPKSYRLPFLDSRFRKARTKKEARILQKASTLISVPKVISVSDTSLNLEYIKGKKLANHLDSLSPGLASSVSKQIGIALAKLHDAGLIHGDLTTSNMILSVKNPRVLVLDHSRESETKDSRSAKNKLYLIDFGLSFESSRAEDKAVDIHLIKQAFEAKHFTRADAYFTHFLKGYSLSSKYQETLARLTAVEKRGRYKASY